MHYQELCLKTCRRLEVETNLEISMKHRVTRVLELIVTCLGMLLLAFVGKDAVAQDSANLPYMNPQLSPEQRATFTA